VTEIIARGPVSRRNAITLALGCLGAYCALYAFAVLTVQGQRWDAESLAAFSVLRSSPWSALYGFRDWMPFFLLAVVGLACVDAMVRRRWLAVGLTVVLVGLTAAISVTSKEGLLPRPELGVHTYGQNTFPSGHTAVCLATVVAVIWLGPRWARPIVVGVMSVLAAATAFVSLISLAHRGSDIIGGALLVGVFSFAILAITPLRRAKASHRFVWSMVGLCALGVAVLVGLLGASPDAIGFVVLLSTVGIFIVVVANQSPLEPLASPSTREAPQNASSKPVV
jgi:hypothetical protein